MTRNHRAILTGCLSACLLAGLPVLTASAQVVAETPSYARGNSFGILAAYSGDSSHMLLGSAENRRLLEFGVSYERRLLASRVVNWQYSGELLPVALESDPNSLFTYQQSTPVVKTWSYSGNPLLTCAPVITPYFLTTESGITYSGTYSQTCSGRKWTIGEGISPVGFQWNFLPRHKLQPFFVSHGGYMYSSKPIPVAAAGSFNFTFDLGAGIELYRTKTRSIRAEYRYHHISNHNTAPENPGIDNGLFQVSYVFGR